MEEQMIVRVDETEQAIQSLEERIAETKESNGTSRADDLNTVGILLMQRYLSTGVQKDVRDAIGRLRESVEVTQMGDSSRPSRLSNLANVLTLQFDRLRDDASLDEAAEIAEEAVKTASLEDPARFRFMMSLANILEDKFSKRGCISDLERAIELLRDVSRDPILDLGARAEMQSNLGKKLRQRFSIKEEIHDLNEAAVLLREAIRNTPPSHPNQWIFHNNLGNILGDRFVRSKSASDLDESIEAFRDAIRNAPTQDFRRSIPLVNMGTRLGDRYQRTGNMSDLLIAIQTLQEAIKLTSMDDADMAGRLVNLGNLFAYRFLKTGAASDLNAAINIYQQAVDAPASVYMSRSARLNNLGLMLRFRYLRFTSQSASHSRYDPVSDLEKAADFLRRSLDAMPTDHPEISSRLFNLGLVFGDMYTQFDSLEKLEGGIQHVRDAISVISRNDPNEAMYLDTLGTMLNDKYSKTKLPSNLSDAIIASQEAVKKTALDNPDLAGRQANLGSLLAARASEPDREDDDLANAISNLTAALNSAGGRVSTRIRAGRALFDFHASTSRWQQAYEIARQAVNLIPLLAPRSLENADKQHLLRQATGLASDSSAAALHSKQDPIAAIEALEFGRCVLSGSLSKLREDVSALEAEHSVLGEQYTKIRLELDSPMADNTSLINDAFSEFGNIQTSRLHDAEQQLESLLQNIRAESGFENFLLPSTTEDVRTASDYGPIVIINTSRYRCDAILILAGRLQVVPLPSLTLEEIRIKGFDGIVDTMDVLEWLWDVVAAPVLDILGYNECPLEGHWPHIWWIPIGPLSKFPIHAAGYHTEGHKRTVLDRVISSYSSSVAAIASSRRRTGTQTSRVQPHSQAVLVAMAKTPEKEPLLFAIEEIETVKVLARSMQLELIEPPRNKQGIITSLPSCDIFHFAGHGSINTNDPLKSYLLLDDWMTNPLTVADILDTHIRDNQPFLAFLSACHTGQIRDENFMDENLHLISAYQLAGFQNVIGTLWKVNDESCLDVARVVYETMKNVGMTNESVSLGLHRAVTSIRDQCVRTSATLADERESGSNEILSLTASHKFIGAGVAGQRNIDGFDDEPTALYWVPYVHFGG